MLGSKLSFALKDNRLGLTIVRSRSSTFILLCLFILESPACSIRYHRTPGANRCRTRSCDCTCSNDLD